MKKAIFKNLLILGSSVVMAAAAHAADPLTLSISQGGGSFNQGFTSIGNLFDTAKSTSSIQQQLPGFNPALAANANLGYLGVNLMLNTGNYAAGSQTLNFVIPEIAVNQTFTGSGPTAESARADAFNKLTDYLKANHDGIYSKIQRLTVAKTPSSVIAGNPNSFQSMTAAADFDASFTGVSSLIAGGPSDVKIPNLICLGFNYGQFKQRGIDTNSESSIGGSKAYSGRLGLAVRVPVNVDLSLTPSIGYSIAESADLAQAAQQASASITSAYKLPYQLGGTGTLSVGNMVGYYKTLSLNAGGYKIDPNIANTVFRNGLMYSHCVS